MASQFIKPKDTSAHKEVIGETIAKLVLFKNGFNVYSRFLDVDAVDMIVRNKKNNRLTYNEIQIKYSKYFEGNKDYWFGVNKRTFEPRYYFYFMFICGDEDSIFIIPSLTLRDFLQKMVFIEKANKWDIHIVNRNERWHFTTKRGQDWIDITTYRNNFDKLR